MDVNIISAIASFLTLSHHKYFPSDVLKWMKSNASITTAVKLMKVCKYSEHKKFAVVPIRYAGWSKNDDITIILSGGLSKNYKIATLRKAIWITESFTLAQRNCMVPLLSSKIIVSYVEQLFLRDQKLSLKDFKFLTSGGRIITIIFSQTTFITNCDNNVTFQDILKCIPKIKNISMFHCTPCDFTETTSFKAPFNLEIIKAYEMNESFDSQGFTNFMIKNQNFKFFFSFDFKLSSMKHRKMINKCIDKIIKEWSHEYQPPEFDCYSSKSTATVVALKNLKQQYFSRQNILLQKKKTKFRDLFF